MREFTVALIKPDAVINKCVGQIINIMERHFEISEIAVMQWPEALAEAFYRDHSGRDFFPALVSFMTSAPIYAITLGADDAIAKWRKLMGPTDPKMSLAWSVRYEFGSKTGPIMHNAVHGSDSQESADQELRDLSIWYGAHFGNATRSRWRTYDSSSPSKAP